MQEMVQSMKNLIDEKMKGLHTVLPGKIIALDEDTGLATVSPTALFEKPDGTTLPYPDISGVPLVFPQSQGQSISIAYPVAEGDGCLILIAQHSLDYWMFDRLTDCSLSHDLTNAIAMVGLFQQANENFLQACDENAVIISASGVNLSVSELGISMKGNVTIDGNLEVKGNSTTSGNASITGTTTLHNSLTVKGATGLESTLSVKGNASMSGQLSVTGTSSFTGNSNFSGSSIMQNLQVNGSLQALQNVNISGDLDVSGDITGCPPCTCDGEDEE